MHLPPLLTRVGHSANVASCYGEIILNAYVGAKEGCGNSLDLDWGFYLDVIIMLDEYVAGTPTFIQ